MIPGRRHGPIRVTRSLAAPPLRPVGPVRLVVRALREVPLGQPLDVRLGEPVAPEEEPVVEADDRILLVEDFEKRRGVDDRAVRPPRADQFV